MSLILKGIDLPKETKEVCVMYKDKEGYLQTYIVKDIIQIPKGHGRIGDLDELQTNVIKAMTYGDALHEIKNAPIILESEEE